MRFFAKIQKQIEDEKQKTESLLESKNHYIKVLENKIFERFDQEAQIRKEIEKKLFALIEDRFNGLKIEISKESRNRYESIENLKNYYLFTLIYFFIDNNTPAIVIVEIHNPEPLSPPIDK